LGDGDEVELIYPGTLVAASMKRVVRRPAPVLLIHVKRKIL
jgi:hypothetical protein